MRLTLLMTMASQKAPKRIVTTLDPPYTARMRVRNRNEVALVATAPKVTSR